MLILFKPWRTEADLRGNVDSWAEAFDEFVQSCSHGTRRVLDNMQILHECKDSKNSRWATRNRVADGERRVARNENSEEPGMDEIMTHIDSVDNYRSRAIAESLANVADCLLELQATGMFSHTEHTHDSVSLNVQQPEKLMLPADDTLESQWKCTYDDRQNAWKRKLSNIHAETSTTAQTRNVRSLTIMNAGDGTSTPVEGQIMQLELSPAPDIPAVSIDEVVNVWSLNVEQARAFRIIASHSIDSGSKLLRMYIGGPGGTG